VSLQEIARHVLGEGTETLYVADEHNCTQWFAEKRVGGEDGFQERCEWHDEPHRWRRVYVKA
jgi:hypothetical protein